MFHNIALRLNAALAGCGLAYLPEDQVRTHPTIGWLIRCSPIGDLALPLVMWWTVPAPGNEVP